MQRFCDKLYNRHWIFLSDDDVPILLPCLYCRYMHITGFSVIQERRRVEQTGAFEFLLKEVEVGESAQYEQGQQLGLFLEWVEEYSPPLVTIDWHIALPADLINEYINEYLIVKLQKSEVVVYKALKSLRNYYNWLACFFDVNLKKIFIFAEYRALARSNNKPNTVVKYLLPSTREALYQHTDNLLEEIVLRNGGELGCRTSENRGLYLDDFQADGKVREGLLSLFKKLHELPYKEEFDYHLPSFDAKYGSARILYIPRTLLQLMERYYNIERPESESNHLLVSNSSNHTKGEVIRKGYGSATFYKTLRKLKNTICNSPDAFLGYQSIDEASVYHHLRHSFGTDVFYNLCENAKKNYETITTESRVYIETARRLGHRVNGRHANQTTKNYIHACAEREAFLRAVIDE